MDILEHLGMKVPYIEGHGVIISRASVIYTGTESFEYYYELWENNIASLKITILR